jgi:hypothetical protein
MTAQPIIPNTAAFRVGDDVVIVRNGQRRLMTIYRIDPPGTQGREIKDGPRVFCHGTGSTVRQDNGFEVRPRAAFDYHTLELDLLRVEPPTTCQAFLDDGSCIHSDHTK